MERMRSSPGAWFSVTPATLRGIIGKRTTDLPSTSPTRSSTATTWSLLT